MVETQQACNELKVQIASTESQLKQKDLEIEQVSSQLKKQAADHEEALRNLEQAQGASLSEGENLIKQLKQQLDQQKQE